MPEMALRPDLLAGLSRRRCLEREQQDAALIQSANNIQHRIASRSALERDAILAGVPTLRAKAGLFRELRPGETVECVVCARVDLDHPIYFPDNLFCDCADCGCRLQYRPDAPAGTRLCICCMARRVREDPDFRDDATREGGRG
ncbi:MAG TPA: hypothetical protein VFA12_20695 [Stellaceae bacterium]|nr:hypothetical protein [Stellaceae bacterium]